MNALVLTILLVYVAGTSSQEWMDALTLGHPDNSYNGQTIDIGEAQFNSAFQNSKYFIIKRACSSCSADYKEIYYKRLTNPASFNAYDYMKRWKSADNIINTNFELYSTLADAISDQNRWNYCNYDDVPGVGAFRDCGKHGGVGCQWTSDVNEGGYNWANCNRPSIFSIYVGDSVPEPSAKSGVLNLDIMHDIFSIENSEGLQMSSYLFWLICGLIIVNCVCITIYCWNLNRKGKRYKVISMHSDTDAV